MKEGTNVSLIVRERGKIVARRDVHNTWTHAGRSYLAELFSFGSYGPDTPQRDDRIKYIAFGIGGAGQNQLAMANGEPLGLLYPAGSDPNTTSGNEYDDETPSDPVIATLERPVPIGAVSSPTPVYSNPASAIWRADLGPSSSYPSGMSHPQPNVVRYNWGFYQGILGGYVFIHNPPLSGNQYSLLPLSEMGLQAGAVGSLAGSPFTEVVTYVTFDTIQISPYTDLEVYWDIVF